MNLLASIAVDSVAYGMILFVISIGLSITLGLMRFVNLAHGVFAMLGGYALALPRNPKQPPAVTPSPTQTSDPTELR